MRRSAQQSRSANKNPAKVRDHQWLVTLWSLRMVLRTNMLPYCRTVHRFGLETIAAITGIDQFNDPKQWSDHEFRQLVKARLARMSPNSTTVQSGLIDNLATLTKELRLTSTEQAVLGVLVLSKTTQLEEMLDVFRDTATADDAATWIAAALGRPRAHVVRALRPGSGLRRSGLISVSREAREFFSKRYLLVNGLSHALMSSVHDLQEFFESHFHVGPTSQLSLADYPHVARDADLLRGYLQAALPRQQSGVNVLVYGVPGVGKTEFARCLAAELAVRLYEVPTADQDGECVRDEDRLRSYRLAQSVLARRAGSVLLFDEAEMALASDRSASMLFGMRNNNRTKAWVLQLLEHNAVPTIWVTNEIHMLEQASIRRFDVVVKFPAPTRSVRKNILDKYLDGLEVTECWIDAQAADGNLMPGHIERAARVVKTLGDRKGAGAEATLGRIVSNTLEAMGQRGCGEPAPAYMDYRLDYLNPDQPLAAVVAGLSRKPTGRLCLYGPPGTGKTAFAHHLGQQLGLPVLERRASDLLDMYVGGTEKNIRDAFAEARAEGAILLLDEADSFLQDRAAANHSWERTQVNELLTQMERFQGVLVTATNLVAMLDQASLRRFDLKIAFNYLAPAQLARLFASVLEQFGLASAGPLDEAIRARLARVRSATPGDFAAIVRRRQLLGAPANAAELLGDLEAEQVTKQNLPEAGIGFLAAS